LLLSSLKLRLSSGLSRGYLICLSATALWSFTGIFIRYLTETYRIPPLLLAFWRDLVVAGALAAALVIINPARLRLGREHFGFILLYGFVLSIFNSLWTVSVSMNGAAVSTVLAYSSAAFTAILGWWLLKESLGWVKIAAVSLTLLGCFFVSGAYDRAAWQLNPVGILTGLLSGLAFAAYNLCGRTSAQRGIFPWTALLHTFFLAAIFILGYNFLAGGLPEGVASNELLWLGSSLAGWGILVILSVGPTIGGFGLYTVSLTYLPASVASIIATLEPVMTTILAFFLLGERLTPPQLAGSLLIISGVILLRLKGQSAYAN
jgi:drug/metabolite transporter (DMT)-like permease